MVRQRELGESSRLRKRRKRATDRRWSKKVSVWRVLVDEAAETGRGQSRMVFPSHVREFELHPKGNENH